MSEPPRRNPNSAIACGAASPALPDVPPKPITVADTARVVVSPSALADLLLVQLENKTIESNLDQARLPVLVLLKTSIVLLGLTSISRFRHLSACAVTV
jgi:hypothetical protein